MEPPSSGHDQVGYIPHPAPQQGTWSMKDVSAGETTGLSSKPGDTQFPSGQAVPLQADDGDLIEREWVEAVKKVINENRDDPFTQCQALTQLKLHYIKKRYGEDIKIPE